jgi:CelD/BcsL family acetyltransferase involved in cellulose biosynthesis
MCFVPATACLRPDCSWLAAPQDGVVDGIEQSAGKPTYESAMTAATTRITLSADHDWAAVEAAWRELESDAAPSLFQSWTWVGCLAEERFRAPVLLRAERDGRTVGLALLGRTRGRLGAERLWLNESGDPALDAVYVEHNGMLLAHDAVDVLPASLHAMLAAPIAPARGRGGPWGRRLRLAGVDAAHLAAAQQIGAVHVLNESIAPFVDLTALPAGPESYLASLSANTRYQIRRSNRCFARLGPLVVRQAETEAEALAFLDALAALHQATWSQRESQGAFANPAFLRFHRALVARALPRGELALLRFVAGDHVLGYLYNIRLGSRVFTYQSGFDYAGCAAAVGPHAKPGLTCHYAAILRAQDEGAAVYDFLAGRDRYKLNLTRAATATRLYWLDAASRGSGQGIAIWLHGLATGRR